MSEFYWGLKDLGVSLTEEDAQSVLSAFDKDRSGAVSFDEFLRTLRGDLTHFRLSLIKKAYQNLDVRQDGNVKLEDIARLYDISRHPEVI